MSLHLLSSREVQAASNGRYSDGGGFFLSVRENGASWIYRYTGPDGKGHDIGLGRAHRDTLVAAGESIKQARDKARRARDILAAGGDPLEKRRADRKEATDRKVAEKARAKAQAPTLCRAARDYHARVIEPKFSDKHSKLWIASLEDAKPGIRFSRETGDFTRPLAGASDWRFRPQAEMSADILPTAKRTPSIYESCRSAQRQRALHRKPSRYWPPAAKINLSRAALLAADLLAQH